MKFTDLTFVLGALIGADIMYSMGYDVVPVLIGIVAGYIAGRNC